MTLQIDRERETEPLEAECECPEFCQLDHNN